MAIHASIFHQWFDLEHLNKHQEILRREHHSVTTPIGTRPMDTPTLIDSRTPAAHLCSACQTASEAVLDKDIHWMIEEARLPFYSPIYPSGYV